MNKRHFYVIWSREGNFVRMGLEPYDPATDGAGCDVCDVYDEDSVEAHSPVLVGYAQPDTVQASEWIQDAKKFYSYHLWPIFNGIDGIVTFYSSCQDRVDSDEIYKALDDTDIPYSAYPELDKACFLTCRREAHWWRDFVDAQYTTRDILDEARPAWDLIHYSRPDGMPSSDEEAVDCALERYIGKMSEVYEDICAGDYAIAEDRMIEATEHLVEDINEIARDAGLLDVNDSNE